MNIGKPFKMIVPDTITREVFKKLKEKKPKFRYTEMDFYIVLNYLLYKEVNLKKEGKYFPVSKIHLRILLGCKPDKYLKFLRETDILDVDWYDYKLHKSYHYRFNPAYKLDCCTVLLPFGSKHYEKRRDFYERKRVNIHPERFEPHIRQIYDNFINMEFDYEKAMERWNQLQDDRKKIYCRMQIEAMADKRMRFFKRSKKNGRLNSSLSNFKKDFRDFFVGDYSLIDLRNSQPFLFNQFLRYILGEGDGGFFENLSANDPIPYISSYKTHKTQTHTTPNPTPSLSGVFTHLDPSETFGRRTIQKISKVHQNRVKGGGKDNVCKELERFSSLVNNGYFYDDFLQYYKGKKELTRDDVKTIMFIVFFSRNRKLNDKGEEFIPYCIEKKRFGRVFPFVAEVIKLLKEKKHNKLSIYLQKMESYIFIDMIAPALVEAGIVPQTIHDSVMVERQHEQQAIEIIKQVFMQQFGIMPILKTEHKGTANRGAQAATAA
jgi:hypothetical protein